MGKTTEKNEVENWLDNLAPDTTSARDGRHLRNISAALAALEQAEIELQTSIDEARAAGDSWEAIGLVLGTSRQAAHRKYANRS